HAVKGDLSKQETLEEIYKWNPDSIIANEDYVREYILTDEKWDGLECVRNKKVYTLPVGISRWAHPSSMENHMAALFLAELYYPEKFEDIDLNEYTKEFYQKFFDLDLDDEQAESILTGVGMRIEKKQNPERKD
ncbi:MAG: hypothetical protein ACI3VR_07625, partial [Intestinibacter sp.]